MKFLKWLFRHRCNYNTPIVSKYVSFNTRDIVYKCKCGKGIIQRIYTPYERPFPIPTTNFITRKDLEKYL